MMAVKTCVCCNKEFDDQTHCEPCPHVEMVPLFGPSEVMGEESDKLSGKMSNTFGISEADAEAANDKLEQDIDKSMFSGMTLAEIDAQRFDWPSGHGTVECDEKSLLADNEIVTVTLIGGLFDGQQLQMPRNRAFGLDSLLPRCKQFGKERVATYENQHDGTFKFTGYRNTTKPHDSLRNDDDDTIRIIPNVAHSDFEQSDDRGRGDPHDDDDDDEFGLFDDAPWQGE